MRFSERYGFKPVREVMQVDSMDGALRNKLWNALNLYVWDKFSEDYQFIGPTRVFQDERYPFFLKILWDSHYKKPTDTIPKKWPDVYSAIRTVYFRLEWWGVYDFLEFIISNFTYLPERPNVSLTSFIEMLNQNLKEELSGFRVVGGEFRPLTSEQETDEIEKVLNYSDSLSPVKTHIQTALNLFSDRENPDYRNSIKESISAVESLCKIITNDENATLGKALKSLEDKIDFHPAFNDALDKLYGYTSDEGGIRHSLMEESKLDLEDARFMLVSCSAFINYLIEKSSKAGIEFK